MKWQSEFKLKGNFFKLLKYINNFVDFKLYRLNSKLINENFRSDFYQNNFYDQEQYFKSNNLIKLYKSIENEKKELNFEFMFYYHTLYIEKENPFSKAFILIKGENYNPYNEIDRLFEKNINIFFIDKKYFNEFLKSLLKLKNIFNINKKYYLVVVENTRYLLSYIIKFLFKQIDEKFFITGVTGTNGKTTIVTVLRELFNQSGLKAASIGSIGLITQDYKYEIPRTTPESYDIFSMLKFLKTQNIENVFIEYSSIASSLKRVDSIDVDYLIFTNFTSDHLDFHKTIENYYNSKLRFIELLAKSSKKDKKVIVNIDDHFSDKVIKKVKKFDNIELITYGKSEEADIRIVNITSSFKDVYSEVVLKLKNNKTIKFNTLLFGNFNAYNLAAVFSVAFSKKISEEKFIEVIKNIKVPGRLERINFNENDIFIDYAHTSDALKNVLQALKKSGYDKIITIFGCGGDRDKEKRPEMGKISEAYSDIVIVTNDNPRSEDPEKIIKDILRGINNPQKVFIAQDRELAIMLGLKVLKSFKNSALLIAGKGHENYQIFKDKKIYFSDFEKVNEIIKKCK